MIKQISISFFVIILGTTSVFAFQPPEEKYKSCVKELLGSLRKIMNEADCETVLKVNNVNMNYTGCNESYEYATGSRMLIDRIIPQAARNALEIVENRRSECNLSKSFEQHSSYNIE